ncbi:MAG: aminotransferase class V-fold PLP-dependent enzyme [Desulfococcaceae bacterium]
MNWNAVQEAFPVNREMIWLNNCGMSPAGLPVAEAMRRFMTGFAERGPLTETETFPATGAAIKAILSRLLNCPPDALALIHHTAEGMNIVSRGLTLGPEDEILLLEDEYPSNVYPWRHWEKRGVTLKTVPAGPSPAAFLDELRANITSRTRVAALSAVHWCTGMPYPLEKIGALLKERHIRFVLDGTQGVGMRPVDVDAAQIDFMAFSAWKWLMGPSGLGVLYVRPERLDELKPVFVGAQSVVKPQEHLPYKDELKPNAERFAVSTPSLADWVWFRAALTFLEEIGFATVRERIWELSTQLARRLRKVGFQLASDDFPDHPTGIVVCGRPEADAKALVAALQEAGVIAAERQGRVRFSPHVYNTPAQIDAAARALSEVYLKDMYLRTVGKR